MKELKHIAECVVGVWGILLAGVLLTGCQSSGPVFADFETAPASRTNDPNGYTKPSGPVGVFYIGDVVTIVFNSGSDRVLEPHQEAVKDDGKINPPLIGPVVAVGKSDGELQAELQEKYKKYFVYMTVTVTARDRYYYVTGEVKSPGPKPYLGETDIIKAITSAGDFTEFANKKKVWIKRSNGKTETINYKQAIEDRQQNVPIHPGDQILVPRSIF